MSSITPRIPYLLLWCCFVLPTIAQAQAETEPNDQRSTANDIALGASLSGRVGCEVDRSDYFLAFPPDDGSITLTVAYTNESNNDGADATTYLYDYRSGTLATGNSINVPAGQTVQDTLTVHCRQRDTVYFRVFSNSCFSYQLSYTHEGPSGPDDGADNDNLATATPIAVDETARGRIGYRGRAGADGSDYYVALPPDDGTIQLTVDYTNESRDDGADATTYLYDYRSGTLATGNSINVPAGQTVRDTLTVHCRQRDTVYFRVFSNSCFSYQLRYTHEGPNGPDDGADNDNLATATPIADDETARGRIGYRGRAGADGSDYYVALPPDDGTIQLTVGYTNESRDDGADATTYLYDYRGGTLATGNSINVPAGQTVRDTLTVHCRQRDTVYFRVFSNSCFSYQLRYTHEGPSGPDDGVDNDNLATATPIAAGETARGRIGYRGRAGVDNSDYYAMAMPDDGTIQLAVAYTNQSRNNGADATTYLYDYRGGTLANGNSINVPAGQTVRDTLTVHCRQRDTVYFRMFSNDCFSYAISPLHSAPAFAPDAEPNDAIASAVVSQAGSSFSGRIGYQGRQGRDASDYYRIIVPELSTMTLRLEAENASGSAAADLAVYLYDKRGATVGSEFLNDRPVGRFGETLTYTCLPADTFYLRVFTSQCFSYRGRYTLRNEQPTAEIEYSRFGNSFAFRPETRRNETILWDFGDMTTSERKYPRKEFDIGVYDVTLEATNSLCNASAIATEQITVTGIEDYTPKRAGQLDGVGVFHIRLFGGGLSEGMEVLLRRGGATVTPVEIYSPGPAEATVKFMAGGLSSGSYDVEIRLDNGEEYNFPNGFEIYADQPGLDVTVEAIAPPRIRTNRWTDVTLRATNNQGRLLNGLPVIVIVPPDVETNILDIVQQKTGRYVIKGDEWNKLTIDRDFFNEVFYNGEFDPVADSIVIDYDEINLVLEEAMTMEFDTLFGEPLEGTGYLMYYPLITQNSSQEIDFQIRSSRNQSVEITAFPLPYTMRTVGTPPEDAPGFSPSLTGSRNVVTDFFEDCAWEDAREYALQAATVLQFAPDARLKAVGEHAGKGDIISQVLFQEFTDYWYGGDVADSDFYQRQTVAFGMEVLGGKLPFGNNVGNLRAQAKLNNEILASTLKQRNGIAKILTRGNNRFANNVFVKNNMLRKIDALDDAIAFAGQNASTLRKLEAMNLLNGFNSTQITNLISGDFQDIIQDDDNPYFAKPKEPKDVKKTPVRSVTSFDPNELYGNAGVGSERFLKRDVALDYTVLFENVDTAQAAAQIVRIELNLDPTKYDLRRTTLGHVYFGGNYYHIEGDRCEYFRDIDLRPARNLLVRVQGKVDTISGDVSWQFTTLDPLSLDLPQGVEDGFLPPNQNPPEGDGSVSFVTYPLPGVSTGDTLATEALIFFDDNSPIRTNTWSNVIDEDRPFSTLDQSVVTLDDSTFSLSYFAEDRTSGVKNYRLHWREEGRPWSGLPADLDASGSTTIRIRPETTYELYVTTQDSVGNQEQKPRRAEITITNGIVSARDPDVLQPTVITYPNPTSGKLYLQEVGAGADAEARVYDWRGRRVYARRLGPGTAPLQLPPHLPAGPYLLHLRGRGGRLWTARFVVAPR